MSPTSNDPPSVSPYRVISPLQDQKVLLLLGIGCLLQLLLAFALHLHFSNATPPHLWPGTDEETFYQLGLNAAHSLRETGWKAFWNAPPASEYFNWLHYKYTGLALYLFSDSPLALRLLSIFFKMVGLALFIDVFGRHLPRRAQRLTLTALLVFFPSYAFWSALAIKEGVLTFLTSILCWGIAYFWKRSSPWPALFWSAAVCYIMGGFRIWAGLGFFLVTVYVLLFCHPGRPEIVPRTLTLVLIAVLLWILPPVQLLTHRRVLTQTTTQELSSHKPKLNVTQNSQTMESEIHSRPIKFLMAAFLPLPKYNSGTPLSRMGSWENVLFLILIAVAIAGNLRKLAPMEILWGGLATIIFAAAIATCFNLGTIYRIKISSLPFIAYFVACAVPAVLPRSRVQPTNKQDN